MTRNELIESLCESYSTWYDMERYGEEKTPLSAAGQFHSTDKSYVLTEKATMWTADSHDYLYIYSMQRLDHETFAKLVEAAKASGEQLIDPGKNHKSSYITALFVCNEADSDAVDALKKYKFRKNFSFGLKGWEEVHTALVRLDDGSIVTNRDGVNTGKFLNNILYPKKKGLLNKLKGV
ncbi:MAG: hypothetical protein Q4E57_00920 [Eubacteriales bacterium]|nr:hypothetical protein [Eubacteriales bacterium]